MVLHSFQLSSPITLLINDIETGFIITSCAQFPLVRGDAAVNVNYLFSNRDSFGL